MSDLEDALEALGITEDEIWREAGDQIEAALDKKAQQVETSWRNASPEDTGDYKEHFGTRTVRDEDGHPVKRVSNQSKHAHIVEYGSEDQKAQFVRAKVAKRFKNEGPYTVQGAS